LKLTTTDQTPEQDVTVGLGFNDDPNRTIKEINAVQVGAFLKKADGSLVSVAQTVTTREDSFNYTIPNLAAGDYEVFAVGDDNNDGDFQANIESFGAYPTRDQPLIVHLDGKGKVNKIDFAIDAAFVTDVVGGIGAACTEPNDCTFRDDATCITSFTNGYCTRACYDGDCGTTGACELLDCDGGTLNCSVCLVRCTTDAQCRTSDGFVCDLGVCVPESFAQH
jgi:hypothetical protein